MNDDWPVWLFEYRWGTDKFSLEIPAPTIEEARERLRLAAQGECYGQLMMKIPATGGSWLPSLMCWWKNLWRVNQ